MHQFDISSNYMKISASLNSKLLQYVNAAEGMWIPSIYLIVGSPSSIELHVHKILPIMKWITSRQREFCVLSSIDFLFAKYVAACNYCWNSKLNLKCNSKSNLIYICVRVTFLQDVSYIRLSFECLLGYI